MELFTPEEFKAVFKVWSSGCWIIFTILISMEVVLRAVGWWRTRNTEDARPLFPADWPANFALFFHSGVINALVGTAAVYGAMQLGYQFSPLRIPFTASTAIWYFLAAEFCFYFNHRLSHEVRLMWADHSIHHSSESYNFSLTWRLPPANWTYKALVYAPVAMLGFEPNWLLLMIGVGIFQVFIHTDRIGKLGLFDHIFCSPANHQVHHARNPIYVDKNYGGATVFWDKLFGTFILPGEEKLRYGITHRVKTGNPFKIWIAEFRLLWIDFIHAPGWKAKLLVLFGRPGETFEYQGAHGAAPAMPALGAVQAAE
jgi:sterol desaturase/sphingolipid hydroxylase (fatty acid hydroxylase superfamily)